MAYKLAFFIFFFTSFSLRCEAGIWRLKICLFKKSKLKRQSTETEKDAGNSKTKAIGKTLDDDTGPSRNRNDLNKEGPTSADHSTRIQTFHFSDTDLYQVIQSFPSKIDRSVDPELAAIEAILRFQAFFNKTTDLNVVQRIALRPEYGAPALSWISREEILLIPGVNQSKVIEGISKIRASGRRTEDKGEFFRVHELITALDDVETIRAIYLDKSPLTFSDFIDLQKQVNKGQSVRDLLLVSKKVDLDRINAYHAINRDLNIRLGDGENYFDYIRNDKIHSPKDILVELASNSTHFQQWVLATYDVKTLKNSSPLAVLRKWNDHVAASNSPISAKEAVVNTLKQYSSLKVAKSDKYTYLVTSDSEYWVAINGTKDGLETLPRWSGRAEDLEAYAVKLEKLMNGQALSVAEAQNPKTLKNIRLQLVSPFNSNLAHKLTWKYVEVEPEKFRKQTYSYYEKTKNSKDAVSKGAYGYHKTLLSRVHPIKTSSIVREGLIATAAPTTEKVLPGIHFVTSPNSSFDPNELNRFGDEKVVILRTVLNKAFRPLEQDSVYLNHIVTDQSISASKLEVSLDDGFTWIPLSSPYFSTIYKAYNKGLIPDRFYNAVD